MPDASAATSGLESDRQLLARLCERLRTAPESRLTRHDERLAGASLAEAVLGTAQWAASSQGVQTPVPVLHPLASGDLLEVVGREFLDWVSNADPHPSQELEQWRHRVDQLRAVV